MSRQPDHSRPASHQGKVRAWLPWLGMVVAVGIISSIVIHQVVWPGYRDPQSRMYGSQLGYVAMLRHNHQPIPVETATPEVRTITEHFVGEGFVRSTPILIPIVPTSRIRDVMVEVGDHVVAGQTLAELDSTNAELRVQAAKVVLAVAEAELERAKIGSSYLMDKERPRKDAIRLQAAEDQAKIRDELDRMSEELAKDQVISRAELLRQKLTTIQLLAEVREAEVALERSQKGREQSIRIAAASVIEAKLALKQRKLELADYKIVAPADGIIERRLIQAGEYNQDPGKPAFLLASGRWFEAYLDQTVTGKVAVGDEARVSLEAFAGTETTGAISAIHPFVSFSSSGPEVNRPIRPSGTGSPEWPSTFSVRVALDETDLPMATGLSGIVRITKHRDVLAVPAAAFLSRTATEALVLVIRNGQAHRAKVSLGAGAAGWTEIRGGLFPQDRVIIVGQHDLQPGDTLILDGEESAKYGKEG